MVVSQVYRVQRENLVPSLTLQCMYLVVSRL